MNCVQGFDARDAAQGVPESSDGAIAQLGERLHGMQEVGGSIPPGSTSLRRLRLLRLGEPYRSEGCLAVARRAKAGWASSLLGKPYRNERPTS